MNVDDLESAKAIIEQWLGAHEDMFGPYPQLDDGLSADEKTCAMMMLVDGERELREALRKLDTGKAFLDFVGTVRIKEKQK